MPDTSTLWNRNFLLSAVINFLQTLVFYTLVVVTAPYAVDTLHASVAGAGLAAGVFVLGTMLGRLGIGSVVDRFGRKATLLVGAVLFGLLTLPYHRADDMVTLLVLRFVHGLTLGVANTAVAAIMAHSIPPERRAEGVGYFSLSTALATAVGPFLGLFLIERAGYAAIFWLCSAIALGGLLAVLLVRAPLRGSAAVPQPVFALASLLEQRAVPIAVITFLAALCYASVLAYLGEYARAIGQVDAASFFFLAYSIAIFCSRPFTGRLIDRRGANLILLPCCLLLAAGMACMALADNAVTLLAAGALIGLGFGNIQSTTQAVAIKLAGAGRMSLATSTWFVFLDAGLGVGPYLLGLLIPHTGLQGLYAIMAVVALGMVPAYWLLHGRRDAVLLPRAIAH